MSKREELHAALVERPKTGAELSLELHISKNYIAAIVADSPAFRKIVVPGLPVRYASNLAPYSEALFAQEAIISREPLGETEPAEPAEIVSRDKRINSLENQLREQQRLYKTALKDDTLAAKVTSNIIGEIKALEKVKISPLVIKRSRAHEAPQSAVCLLSCAHFGEVVDVEGTMGLGNYTPALAAARWQYYTETVIDLALNHHSGEEIDELHVVNVGDNVSGDIHEELKVSNAFPLGAQIVRQAYLLSYGLIDLAKHFKKVKFTGIVGNHGRFEKKPSFKDKYNNSDWIVYNMVQALVRDQPNIECVIPKSWFHTENIQGREFFFAHGDNIRGFSGFPWYDCQRFTASMAQVMTAQNLPYPEYWCFGQFHQTTSAQLSYGEWIFTGSWKGVDEYALGKLRTGTPPAQMFFGVHPRRGVSFRYPVVLKEADPNIQDRYLAVADPLWTPGT